MAITSCSNSLRSPKPLEPLDHLEHLEHSPSLHPTQQSSIRPALLDPQRLQFCSGRFLLLATAMALVAATVLFIPGVSAAVHSNPQQPPENLFPGIPQFMGTPRSVRSYDFVALPAIKRISKDALELSFNAYNRSFLLHLLPNHQLIHQNALVEIHDSEFNLPPVVMSIPTNTVFDGKVIKTNIDGKMTEDGWARITFNTPDFYENSDILFDGVIQAGPNMFHVKRIDHYRIAQRHTDVEVASPYSRQFENWKSKMMIFTDEAELVVEKRWGPVSDCQASDPAHPLSKRSLNSSMVVQQSGECILPDNAQVYTRIADEMRNADERMLFTRAPTGCPSSMQVLPMGVAADCSYVQSYGSTSAALQQILSNWNMASKVYESSFNIQLAVVKVNLQQSCTPSDPKMVWNQDCTNGYTITTRLSDFSNWRGNVEGNGDNIGLWHLMTKCSTQPAVGVAWLNMLCSQSATSQTSNGVNQFVSGTGVSSIVPVEWKVVAHEIGHGFGAYHDCMSSTCPCSGSSASCQCTPCSPNCDCQGQFLMHPLDNAATNSFSPASISAICSQYASLGKCLKAPGTFSTISTGICGNGVKEGNEGCDCGLPSDCAKDPCCDGTTCKLKSPATCDDLNDNCCRNCQLVSAGTVCHPSLGSCDLTMTCNGINATCPTNSSIADGSSCNTVAGASAQCASGVCTSRDLQCSGSGSVVTVSACPAFTSSCALYCQNGAGNCFLLNGYFLDGTPCGYTGKCSNGVCAGGNPGWNPYQKPAPYMRAQQRRPPPPFRHSDQSGNMYPPPSVPPPPFHPESVAHPPPFAYGHQNNHLQAPLQQPGNGWVNPAAYNGDGGGMSQHSGGQPPSNRFGNGSTAVVNNGSH
ncbi:hypothetical protein BASA50_007886 [Batrachochytrium salamandrivorans]|uniref:Disintegrin domain-containing protein n=1 Tax=Batrachochytrium salamandrivorans TaxID=1357716 RepID=A0ABQ8F781_9FUNG|nr:hypothetical protein BASA50_007886 [Batrachochytrium salamandrivorans]